METNDTSLLSEAWRAAFEAQATEEMMARVYTFAASHAAMIERVTRQLDPLIARELVLDAMEDTFAGVVRWDPERVALDSHLCQVIRSRSSHELQRARRFPHISLDNPRSLVELEEAASSAMASAREATADDVVDRARAVLAEIRRLAAADPPVLGILDAFETGRFQRRQILKFTGMTKSTYHNAMRRLRRLAKRVTSDSEAETLARLVHREE